MEVHIWICKYLRFNRYIETASMTNGLVLKDGLNYYCILPSTETDTVSSCLVLKHIKTILLF